MIAMRYIADIEAHYSDILGNLEQNIVNSTVDHQSSNLTIPSCWLCFS